MISKTDAAILGLLTIEPMSGYDMKKFCEQSLAHFWHESYGNLYPRLRRLEGAGLVQSRREARERAPDANVYALTAAGRHRFTRWLEEEPEPERVRNELLLKIFFGARFDPARAAELVRRDREQQREKLDGYREIERMLSAELADHPDAVFWLMTLRRGQLLTEARIRWCDECARSFDSLPEGGAS